MSDSVKLVGFTKEQPARLLVHYLSTQGITANYQFNDNDYPHVVLVSAKDERLAKEITEEFILNPNDTKYQVSAWDSADVVNLRPMEGVSFAGIAHQLRHAPVTGAVLVVCLMTFVLGNLGISTPYDWLHIEPLSELSENGEWWRLIGPAFIHYSLLHIVFNLLWWWSLGQQIEARFGRLGLIGLLVFSAALSNLGQLLVSGPNFGGLSGVVYALVGSVWWFGWLKPKWGLGLPKPIIGFMLVWLLIGYMDVLPVNMANTAHSLGLVSGCIFAWLLSTFSSDDKGNS